MEKNNYRVHMILQNNERIIMLHRGELMGFLMSRVAKIVIILQAAIVSKDKVWLICSANE